MENPGPDSYGPGGKGDVVVGDGEGDVVVGDGEGDVVVGGGEGDLVVLVGDGDGDGLADLDGFGDADFFTDGEVDGLADWVVTAAGTTTAWEYTRLEGDGEADLREAVCPAEVGATEENPGTADRS